MYYKKMMTRLCHALGVTVLAGGILTAMNAAHAQDDWLGSLPDNQSEVISANFSEDHAQFVQSVLTYTEQTNRAILQDRSRLLALQAIHMQKKALAASDAAWLAKLALSYKITSIDFSRDATWQELLKRVDIVPASLVLAQAIQESGWGKSHLAQSANNFFGQECFHPGCGVKAGPVSRHSYHEMAKFDSIETAIKTYINNLNSNRAYKMMRDIRFHERIQHKKVNSVELANGLNAYSELHARYINAIKSVVSKFHLQRFD